MQKNKWLLFYSVLLSATLSLISFNSTYAAGDDFTICPDQACSSQYFYNPQADYIRMQTIWIWDASLLPLDSNCLNGSGPTLAVSLSDGMNMAIDNSNSYSIYESGSIEHYNSFYIDGINQSGTNGVILSKTNYYSINLVCIDSELNVLQTVEIASIFVSANNSNNMDATSTTLFAAFTSGFSQATLIVVGGVAVIITFFLALAGVVYIYKWAKGSLQGRRK